VPRMKVVSIVGARPQFIKCAMVSRELRKVATEVLVHTGQHYDGNMSDVFFHELAMPAPDYNLGVGSGSHGQQTGEMLKKIEEVLLKENPDSVIVYGDTNSTVAGALSAVKLHIPVTHIEAGLRSFNRHMPEEVNRVVTDHLSTLLFCPTETAVNHLAKEGITQGVYCSGDVMYDALLYNLPIIETRSSILQRLMVRPKEYLLATAHRAENIDQRENLQNILASFIGLAKLGETVIFPVHPRTRKQIDICERDGLGNLRFIDPVSYWDMLALERHAKVILTDSGGVQKEAYWLRVPCVTLREETEWIETVKAGWNVLSGTHVDTIIEAVRTAKEGEGRTQWLFGKGDASQRIVNVLIQ